MNHDDVFWSLCTATENDGRKDMEERVEHRLLHECPNCNYRIFRLLNNDNCSESVLYNVHYKPRETL